LKLEWSFVSNLLWTWQINKYLFFLNIFRPKIIHLQI
jgi:hypothetical protein